MTARQYPIRIGARSAPLLRVVFGVMPDNAWAMVDGGEMVTRFGRFEFRVPVANITRWRIEGPWRWITAIGVRGSVRQGDFTFAGSHRGGVRMDFAAPVQWSGRNVPAFYVGVEELEAFAAELAALGIPGEDVRTGR
jgi:hypothetical protein